jgi:hypothetical protein
MLRRRRRTVLVFGTLYLALGLATAQGCLLEADDEDVRRRLEAAYVGGKGPGADAGADASDPKDDDTCGDCDECTACEEIVADNKALSKECHGYVEDSFEFVRTGTRADMGTPEAASMEVEEASPYTVLKTIYDAAALLCSDNLPVKVASKVQRAITLFGDFDHDTGETVCNCMDVGDITAEPVDLVDGPSADCYQPCAGGDDVECASAVYKECEPRGDRVVIASGRSKRTPVNTLPAIQNVAEVTCWYDSNSPSCLGWHCYMVDADLSHSYETCCDTVNPTANRYVCRRQVCEAYCAEKVWPNRYQPWADSVD